jgi:hypothetical protein
VRSPAVQYDPHSSRRRVFAIYNHLQAPSLALNQAAREELRLIDQLKLMLRTVWLLIAGRNIRLVSKVEELLRSGTPSFEISHPQEKPTAQWLQSKMKKRYRRMRVKSIRAESSLPTATEPLLPKAQPESKTLSLARRGTRHWQVR